MNTVVGYGNTPGGWQLVQGCQGTLAGPAEEVTYALPSQDLVLVAKVHKENKIIMVK